MTASDEGGPTGSGEPLVDPTAAGFGQVADLYDRARPGYPAAAVDAVVARLGVQPNRRILDVGAGTGRLTIPLLTAGADVTAVEPVAGMREQLARGVPDELAERLTVLAAGAEELPLDDASVDGAAAAQAFHWFTPEPALLELQRVLVPDAWFAVVHNRRELTSPPQAALEDLLRPHRGTTPSWIDTSWSDILSDPPGFHPAELLTFSHEQVLDLEGFVARVSSISFVAQLPPPTRHQVLEATRVLFTMLERDQQVRLAYSTEVRLLQRRAP